MPPCRCSLAIRTALPRIGTLSRRCVTAPRTRVAAAIGLYLPNPPPLLFSPPRSSALSYLFFRSVPFFFFFFFCADAPIFSLVLSARIAIDTHRKVEHACAVHRPASFRALRISRLAAAYSARRRARPVAPCRPVLTTLSARFHRTRQPPDPPSAALLLSATSHRRSDPSAHSSPLPSPPSPPS